MRSQDLLVACKLAVSPGRAFTLQALGRELRLSISDVHGALARNRESRLCLRREVAAANGQHDGESRGIADAAASYRRPRQRHVDHVDRISLFEFLVFGVGHVFPAERSALATGMPTALSDNSANSRSHAIVWPTVDGQISGESLEPLHKSVPFAASVDRKLYDLLSAVDAIRLGDRKLRRVAGLRIAELLALPRGLPAVMALQGGYSKASENE